MSQAWLKSSSSAALFAAPPQSRPIRSTSIEMPHVFTLKVTWGSHGSFTLFGHSITLIHLAGDAAQRAMQSNVTELSAYVRRSSLECTGYHVRNEIAATLIHAWLET